MSEVARSLRSNAPGASVVYVLISSHSNVATLACFTPEMYRIVAVGSSLGVPRANLFTIMLVFGFISDC